MVVAAVGLSEMPIAFGAACVARMGVAGKMPIRIGEAVCDCTMDSAAIGLSEWPVAFGAAWATRMGVAGQTPIPAVSGCDWGAWVASN